MRDEFPWIPKRPGSSLERPISPGDLEAGVFDLLGEQVEIGRERPDWRLGRRAEDRLWTVTLHYHGWAVALAEAAAGAGRDAEVAARLLRHYLGDWIRRCPWHRPGAADLAWNAYAIATRVESWSRVYLASRSRVFAPAPELEGAFLGSLYQQAAYLNDHVEWDLRGNHLLRDAVGLAWAGRFFAGQRPRAWLRRATVLGVEQATEQVLPDGGHFERSPGYHAEAMEDLLILALLLEDTEARARLCRTWARMAEFLAWMRHPDGDLPLLNDASLRGVEAIGGLLGLAERIGVAADASPRRGGRHFADTGVAVWHGDPWTLFFDLGPIGPGVQPGHAHADTLTLEASFAGRRLFVDPGTFSYDDDECRAYDRGTEAHNTVAIDGADSSEMWKIFRVGRRACPHAVAVEIGDRQMTAAGAHDGYDHLPGRPRHHRRVSVEDGGALTVVDSVTGSGRHRVAGGLLIAPPWVVEEKADGWRLSEGEHRLEIAVDGAATLERSTEERPYHPRCGVEQRATRIGWLWRGELPLEVRAVVEAGG